MPARREFANTWWLINHAAEVTHGSRVVVDPWVTWASPLLVPSASISAALNSARTLSNAREFEFVALRPLERVQFS